MKAAVAIVCAVFAAGTAASKEYVVDLQAGPQQQSQFIQGREVIVSRMPASNTLIQEALDPFAKRAVMIVGVGNMGSEPFNFGPENVSVIVAGKAVAMLSYEDLLNEQKRRESRQRFAMALAGAMNSASASYAGNSYGTSTYSGTTYGNVGGMPYSAQTTGVGTYSGYDAAAAQAAQARVSAENARNAAALEASSAARRAQIEQVVRINTILPGQTFNGPVQFEVPENIAKSKSPVPIEIVVRAGNETHTFQALIGTSKAFRGKK